MITEKDKELLVDWLCNKFGFLHPSDIDLIFNYVDNSFQSLPTEVIAEGISEGEIEAAANDHVRIIYPMYKGESLEGSSKDDFIAGAEWYASQFNSPPPDIEQLLKTDPISFLNYHALRYCSHKQREELIFKLQRRTPTIEDQNELWEKAIEMILEKPNPGYVIPELKSHFIIKAIQ